MSEKLDGFFSPWLKKKRIKMISQNMRNISSSDVLDIGCDDAYILQFLRPVVPKHYVGIDFNHEQIDINKKYYPSKNIEFLASDALDFRINKKFDYILLSAIIEHISDIKKFKEQIKRHSKKSTKILVTTPKKASDPILKIGSYFGLFSKESLDEHETYFNKRMFQNFFCKPDFRIIKYDTFEFGLNQLVVSERL